MNKSMMRDLSSQFKCITVARTDNHKIQCIRVIFLNQIKSTTTMIVLRAALCKVFLTYVKKRRVLLHTGSQTTFSTQQISQFPRRVFSSHMHHYFRPAYKLFIASEKTSRYHHLSSRETQNYPQLTVIDFICFKKASIQKTSDRLFDGSDTLSVFGHH